MALLIPEDFEAFEVQKLTADDAGGVGALTDLTVTRCSRERAEIQQLANSNHSDAYFFFHPDALASPNQFTAVRSVVRGIPLPVARQLFAILEGASQELSPAVHNDRHIFDDLESSVFVDWAHTNEHGASVAAASVYKVIRSPLMKAGS